MKTKNEIWKIDPEEKKVREIIFNFSYLADLAVHLEKLEKKDDLKNRINFLRKGVDFLRKSIELDLEYCLNVLKVFGEQRKKSNFLKEIKELRDIVCAAKEIKKFVELGIKNKAETNFPHEAEALAQAEFIIFSIEGLLASVPTPALTEKNRQELEEALDIGTEESFFEIIMKSSLLPLADKIRKVCNLFNEENLAILFSSQKN